MLICLSEQESLVEDKNSGPYIYRKFFSKSRFTYGHMDTVTKRLFPWLFFLYIIRAWSFFDHILINHYGQNPQCMDKNIKLSSIGTVHFGLLTHEKI